MKLPIILDTCTLLNILRIDDEDEFLFKKLSSLKINICNCVYNEAYKNIISKDGFDEQQKAYILKQMPQFARYIKSFNEDFVNQYSDEIKRFCSYTKDNGEFYSTLLSLYVCRDEDCRVFFYTDDFPAKCAFGNYFVFQQIGTVGDSVDLLLFLYWINVDFKLTQLYTYLRELYLSYAKPLSSLSKKINENKEIWVSKKIADKNFIYHIDILSNGIENLDFTKINEARVFFKTNKKKYSEINNLIEECSIIEAKSEIAKKIYNIKENYKNYKIYKKQGC